MAEVGVAGRLHVEHGHKRRAYNPVEYPLERHGDGHGLAAYGVWEYLGNEHPAYRAPRHHERCAVDHDAHHAHHAHRGIAEGEGHAKCSHGHAYAAGDEQRPAAPLLDGEDGHEGEQDVDNAHHDGVDHGVGHAHVAEDARSIVQHGVDAYGLLEHAEHDADEDYHDAVCEQSLGLLGDGGLYLVQNLAAHGGSVDALQYGQGLVVAPGHDKVARSLRHEAYQQREQPCRHGLAAEHVAPSRRYGPCGLVGVEHLHGLNHRVGVLAEDDEIDEVDHELAEDDGKLVPRDERSAYVRRRHLGNVHGADGRGKAHAHASDDAVDVERHEQFEVWHAMLEYQELGLHRPQGRYEKHHARKEQRLLSAPV